MKLKFWNKKSRPAKRTRRVEVIRRESLRLRLGEWRSDPKLVAEARKVFSQESFLIMLDVLRNENPTSSVLPIGMSSNDRSVVQARGEGYNMAIANLEAMANGEEPHEEIEAEFLPEEIQVNKL